jgi:hypothetical protein
MKYDDEVIFNMDEMPLTINMPLNYVIEKKVKKVLLSELRTKKNTD